MGAPSGAVHFANCGQLAARRVVLRLNTYSDSIGPACALRAYGQHLMGSSVREKKRAVVAVARKLAVLLLSLWKHGTDYEPRVPATPTLVMIPA